MKAHASFEQVCARGPSDTRRFDIRGALRAGRKLLETYQMRAETRRQLARLNERELRDIGIDIVDAATEAAKPFWRK